MTSIIILNYNTCWITAQCIKSIRAYTNDYEIIVVDNGSVDGSVEWFKSQSDIRLICNKENLGFPKGCNQGMEIAKGSEILLLNSDTVVTSRWLDQMRHALYSNDYIGAVSCVTSSCSNGQKLSNLPYDVNTLEGLQEFADEYNHLNPKKWLLRTMLVGFCFLFKSFLYNKIGGLDERFSPGNYEDDDYSIRILKAGYKLLLCQDTFIHHYGRVSFILSSSQEELKKRAKIFNDLLNRNRLMFYKKWDLPVEVWKSMRIGDLISLLKNKHPDDKWRLDSEKICIIIHVKNKDNMLNMKMWIKELIIPNGKKLEIMPINIFDNIVASYNWGMEHSDAKYKLYIQDNVQIIKREFLVDLINMFEQSDEYGIAGVIGCRRVTSNDEWWKNNLVGAIAKRNTVGIKKYLYERNINNPYEVEALNGLVLMTQVDIPWEERNLNNCYDIGRSQCTKFWENGYKALVIPQDMPQVVVSEV